MSGNGTIPDEAITALKARVNLAEVVSAKVTLKGSGDDLVGLCPFHNEKTPSFHVHPERGFFKCFGCGKHGDVINFVQETEGLSFNAAVEELGSRFNCAPLHGNGHAPQRRPIPTRAPSETWKAIQSTMRPGTDEELDALAELRAIPSIVGLVAATAAGQLFFADIRDEGETRPAWLITDSSRRNAQARRMDGQPWDGIKAKAKTIAGCEASWPIGAADVNAHDIALVEGGPDFLAAWHVIATTKADNIRPIGMLGASNPIHADALPALSNKRAWVFPHQDEAGQKAGRRWSAQLAEVMASARVFDFIPHKVKDLNELVSAGAIPPLFRDPTPVMDFGGMDEPHPADSEATPTVDEDLDVTPITDFAYPEGDDPTSLLGADDYLNKGGGMLFVSYAGVGKSSWIMDACMMWALGRPWLGIRCARPLKCLIIQAEDSARYVGKIFSSFAHANQLTAADLATLGTNCVVKRLKGVYGAQFFLLLKALVKRHQPDLVIINPVYLFAEGDIGRSEFAQPFIANLEAVNHEEKFAYILVHHTGKPAAKHNGKRPETEDWESVYMGFGSSYFANWPRCSALLEPVSNSPGRFRLKLGKGRYNAGLTKKVPQGAGHRLETVTSINLKHSTGTVPVGGQAKPLYYWELDTDPPPVSENGKSNSGRPEKYSFDDYRNIFPKKSGDGLELAPLHKLLNGNHEITKGTLHNCLKRWVEEGLVEVLKPDGRYMRYRMAV